MQIHQIKPKHLNKDRKRVGRGGKRGTFSGRGVKGQKSRSGKKMQPVIREIIKRYPKLKGYRFSPILKTGKARKVVLNLDVLEKNFKAGEKVTPRVLIEKKLISKIKGKMPLVKILGKGELTKALTIEKCELSEKAKTKIEKIKK